MEDVAGRDATCDDSARCLDDAAEDADVGVSARRRDEARWASLRKACAATSPPCAPTRNGVVVSTAEMRTGWSWSLGWGPEKNRGWDCDDSRERVRGSSTSTGKPRDRFEGGERNGWGCAAAVARTTIGGRSSIGTGAPLRPRPAAGVSCEDDGLTSLVSRSSSAWWPSVATRALPCDDDGHGSGCWECTSPPTPRSASIMRRK